MVKKIERIIAALFSCRNLLSLAFFRYVCCKKCWTIFL